MPEDIREICQASVHLLSILYLRCPQGFPEEAPRAFFAFNSLFEMPAKSTIRYSDAGDILSILYLRCRQYRASSRAMLRQSAALSILYLRCPFSVTNDVGALTFSFMLSILYLRCASPEPRRLAETVA